MSRAAPTTTFFAVAVAVAVAVVVVVVAVAVAVAVVVVVVAVAVAVAVVVAVVLVVFVVVMKISAITTIIRRIISIVKTSASSGNVKVRLRRGALPQHHVSDSEVLTPQPSPRTRSP